MQEFELFNPGEKLVVQDNLSSIIPIREEIIVRFPGRIHMSPIDCNRFGFGQPGGGGVGFAVRLNNKLEVKIATQITVEGPERQKAVLLHWSRLMMKTLSFSGGVSLSLTLCSEMDRHSGLGSSVAIAAACLSAINKLFGEPYTKIQLRDMITNNFVEQCRGKVTRGLETGVGSYLVLNGGFCAIGDDTVLLSSSHKLDGYPVLLVFPKVSRPHENDPESLEMFNRSLRLDESYRYVRAYRIMMDMLPALNQGDLRAIGDVVWEFQFSGTHQSMIQGYNDGGVEIIRTMTILRQSGADIVGMSSVGPTVYAISENLEHVIQTAKDEGFQYTISQVEPLGDGVVQHE